MEQSMKQPHEGVRGQPRQSYLLSLDERALEHRDALMAMASHLHDACLVGEPAPKVARMYERIREPQIGDLVIETTTMNRRDQDARVKGFGVLLERREEWWESDEDWSAAKAEDGSLTDADRATDDAWYIQYGPEPADVCRWTNCSFITVPVDLDMFRLPIGQRNGSGVTITRNDLLGGLVDSGFTLRQP